MVSSEAPRSETTISTNATYYGVTISKHQKLDYVDKSDLDTVIVELKQRLNTFNPLIVRYENSGKYGQLHCHIYGSIKEYFRYKNNNSILGYRIQWDRLKTQKDKFEWVKYINKEVNNKYRQDQILMENLYKYKYGFTDSI